MLILLKGGRVHKTPRCSPVDTYMVLRIAGKASSGVIFSVRVLCCVTHAAFSSLIFSQGSGVGWYVFSVQKIGGWLIDQLIDDQWLHVFSGDWRDKRYMSLISHVS